MKYPGRIIKMGEQDASIVTALKKQLNKMLGDETLHLDPANANFGPETKQTVRLFQTRHVDNEGRPLKQDGEIGSLTWEALFGVNSVPVNDAPSGKLLAKALGFACKAADDKIKESPVNSNRGPEVDEYLKRVGVRPGFAWCAAFVYFCFDEAAKAEGRNNPVAKTAGCLDHWNKAAGKGAARIMKSQAAAQPGLLKPGMIFIMDHGDDKGHTGLIEAVRGGLLSTIEGNTDASKTREGGGVYRLTRKIVDINKGFIDYSQA